jgi:hypothetical protein
LRQGLIKLLQLAGLDLSVPPLALTSLYPHWP